MISIFCDKYSYCISNGSVIYDVITCTVAPGNKMPIDPFMIHTVTINNEHGFKCKLHIIDKFTKDDGSIRLKIKIRHPKYKRAKLKGKAMWVRV